MLFLSSEKIRQLEIEAMKNVTSIQLIKNAATALYEQIKGYNSVRVYCGKGNNGSDGYATAIVLMQNGKKVEIVQVMEPESEECIYFFRKAMELGIEITDKVTFPFESFECNLDAIFGIGIKGEVSDDARKAIEVINASDGDIVSVDLPSGMNGDTGEGEICVHAHKTVTFTAPKRGMIFNRSVDLCGEIIVSDVGIPVDYSNEGLGSVIPITEKLTKSILPKRSRLSHKGTFGTAVIVAGSTSMSGAAAMAAQAAYKSGCGLVKIIAPESICAVLNILVKEAVVVPVPHQNGIIRPELNDVAYDALHKASAVLAGCGLGKGTHYTLISNILSATNSGVIIDADGLNALSGHLDIIKNRNVLLTPHPLEFSRISGICVEDIEKARITCADKFAIDYGVTLLLKGARSVIAYGGNNKYVSLLSTSALAKAGSGDVLAGIAVSLASQGLSITDSGVAACYIHGRAGMLLEKRIGAFGTTADDIIKLIPEIIRAI